MEILNGEEIASISAESYWRHRDFIIYTVLCNT